MKHHIPDIIKKNAFACFTSLNAAERAVVMFGDEAYRESLDLDNDCLLYTSPSPRDQRGARMPSSA